MNKIGYELRRRDRNLIGALWTILGVCFWVLAIAWWLGTSVILLLSIYTLLQMAYHGTPVQMPRDTFSAWWFLGGATLLFYVVSVKPFLRGGAFRR